MTSRYCAGVGRSPKGSPGPPGNAGNPGRYMCIWLSTAPRGIGVRGAAPVS